MGQSNTTHVANATYKKLRVYYNSEKMILEELVIETQTGFPETSTGNYSTKMVFKRDSRLRYIKVPPRDFIKIHGEGAIYISVLVEDDKDETTCREVICRNFYIPFNRSFIVTQNETVKFQMYGGNIWVDENGLNHYT